jgi:hypothetical protein
LLDFFDLSDLSDFELEDSLLLVSELDSLFLLLSDFLVESLLSFSLVLLVFGELVVLSADGLVDFVADSLAGLFALDEVAAGVADANG